MRGFTSETLFSGAERTAEFHDRRLARRLKKNNRTDRYDEEDRPCGKSGGVRGGIGWLAT